jgi:uncharacterized protein (TIGR02217 family)
MGQMYGFRWKDWSDYKSSVASADPTYLDQVIATGDGVVAVFPLVKTYRSGEQSYARPITKPVLGSVRIGLDQDEMQEGIDYQVDVTTGLITFQHPPDIAVQVRAGFEFDVPVRFDTDQIQTSVANFQAGSVPNVPIVEVRV